jgi:PAT family beta-lactamase induction signal transducer AmpG
VSLRRKLAIIALVYVIEGFPMGLYQGLLPAYFTSFVDLEGDLPIFGWLSFLYVAWSAKVLWSPLVDRFGERRQWIAGAMITMTLCCVGIANADPAPLGVFLWGCVVLYCLASATQDVAIDAYSIGLVDRGEEGPFNSMKATAYRVGMLTSGSCLLLLPRWIGWDGTFAAAALLSAAFAASVRLAPPVPVPLESRRATIEPLRRWLSQTSVLPVFFFVLLYRVGDRAMAPMVMPFWRARGLAYEEIAAINAFFGVGATILGAVVGGIGVARFGIGRSLWAMGILALASNLGYATAANFPEAGRLGVYGASMVESFTAGLAGAAFLSYLMRICEKEHAAVQYALLTAIYALSGAIIALPSGWLTERMGYAAYFALTAALALPAFAFLPRARAWIGEDRPYFRS